MTAPDRNAAAKFMKAAERAVADSTEFLLEQSNRTVPIEEATLERSGTATSDKRAGTITGVVAYDTPYAAVQHEDTTLNHDKGRRAKWLERTIAEETANVGKFIAKELAAAT